MNRWPFALLNHWRAKLLSLAVAALVWLALRHAIPPASAAPASSASPTLTPLP